MKIEDLKRRLVDVASVPFDRQRLICRGRIMNNDETLLDHGQASISQANAGHKELGETPL